MQNQACLWTPAELSGWLDKKGSGYKSWTKRFFILKGSGLFYFTDLKASSARGVIPIELAKVEATTDKLEKDRFLIKVWVASAYKDIAKHRRYTLSSTSSQVQATWVTLLWYASVPRPDMLAQLHASGQLQSLLLKYMQAAYEHMQHAALQGGSMGDQAALQAELDPWDPAAYQNAMHLMTNQGTPSFLSSIQAEADAEDQPISNPAVVQRLSVMARQPADSPSLRPFNMLGTPAPDVGVLPQPRQTLGHSQAAEQAYANGLTAAHEQEVASMQAGYGSEFWGAREVQLGVGAQQEECLDWTAGSASTAGKAQDSDVPSVASRSFALHRQPDKQAAVPQQTTASPFPGFQLGNTHNKPKPSQLKHARHSNAAGPSDNNAGGLLSHEAASALTQSREGLQSSARHSSTAPLGSRLQPSADSTIPAHWPGLDHGPGKQLGLDNKSDLRTRQDQQVGSKLAKKSKVAATLGSTAVGEAVTSSKTKPSIAQRIRSSIFGGAAAPQQPIQDRRKAVPRMSAAYGFIATPPGMQDMIMVPKPSSASALRRSILASHLSTAEPSTSPQVDSRQLPSSGGEGSRVASQHRATVKPALPAQQTLPKAQAVASVSEETSRGHQPQLDPTGSEESDALSQVIQQQRAALKPVLAAAACPDPSQPQPEPMLEPLLAAQQQEQSAAPQQPVQQQQSSPQQQQSSLQQQQPLTQHHVQLQKLSPMHSVNALQSVPQQLGPALQSVSQQTAPTSHSVMQQQSVLQKLAADLSVQQLPAAQQQSLLPKQQQASPAPVSPSLPQQSRQSQQLGQQSGQSQHLGQQLGPLQPSGHSAQSRSLHHTEPQQPPHGQQSFLQHQQREQQSGPQQQQQQQQHVQHGQQLFLQQQQSSAVQQPLSEQQSLSQQQLHTLPHQLQQQDAQLGQQHVPLPSQQQQQQPPKLQLTSSSATGADPEAAPSNQQGNMDSIDAELQLLIQQHKAALRHLEGLSGRRALLRSGSASSTQNSLTNAGSPILQQRALLCRATTPQPTPVSPSSPARPLLNRRTSPSAEPDSNLSPNPVASPGAWQAAQTHTSLGFLQQPPWAPQVPSLAALHPPSPKSTFAASTGALPDTGAAQPMPPGLQQFELQSDGNQLSNAADHSNATPTSLQQQLAAVKLRRQDAAAACVPPKPNAHVDQTGVATPKKVPPPPPRPPTSPSSLQRGTFPPAAVPVPHAIPTPARAQTRIAAPPPPPPPPPALHFPGSTAKAAMLLDSDGPARSKRPDAGFTGSQRHVYSLNGQKLPEQDSDAMASEDCVSGSNQGLMQAASWQQLQQVQSAQPMQLSRQASAVQPNSQQQLNLNAAMQPNSQQQLNLNVAVQPKSQQQLQFSAAMHIQSVQLDLNRPVKRWPAVQTNPLFQSNPTAVSASPAPRMPGLPLKKNGWITR